MRAVLPVLVLMLCAGGVAYAQTAPVPAAPVAGRDASGRVTIRAVRLEAPLTLDGQLDEAVYRDTPAITEFIKSLRTDAPTAEPQKGPIYVPVTGK